MPSRDKMARDKRRHGDGKRTTIAPTQADCIIGFAAEVNYAAPLNSKETAEFD
jgi:hypothetical protein